VVGHDFGGTVAWKLAHDYPHTVDRLIVINGPHPDAFALSLKTHLMMVLNVWQYWIAQLPFIP
jgi:pimeloyl-ACP methyl ester carboxylesterase